jgi:uncharacterized membrane protein
MGLVPAQRPSSPSTFVIVSSWILALGGLGISTYLTIVHFVGTQILACAGNGAISCEIVTTSAQSRFLGMPVSVLGLSYFVAAVILYSPWAWWASWRALHLIRIAASVVGMAMVLWLISAELLIIHKICLWCSGVHVITFLLFVITITTAPAVLNRDDDALDDDALDDEVVEA